MISVQKHKSILPLLLLLFLSACLPPMGPSNQRRDRVSYDRSVTKGLQEELLLNIVQLRFGDALNFLVTQQLITNYSYQKNLSGSVAGSPWGPTGPNINGLGIAGQLNFSDNPTATYQPLNGDQAANLILYPLRPITLLALLQSDIPVDMLMSLTVESFGNLENVRNATKPGAYGADIRKKFALLIKDLRKLQLADALSIRQQSIGHPVKNTRLVPGRLFLEFMPADTPEIAAIQREIRQILDLPPDIKEFEMIFGHKAQKKSEIRITTRSMLSVMSSIASTIEVPPKTIKAGATQPTVSDHPEKDRPTIIIHCNRIAPLSESFVSIRYNGYAYWISKNDLASKKAFSLLQIINSLAINRIGDTGALVTIPAEGWDR